MKKIITILLTLTLALTLTACDDNSKEPSNDIQKNDSTSQSESQTNKPYNEELTIEYLKSLPETPVEEFDYDSNWDDDGIVIIRYNGNSDVVVIPNEIEGRPVKELAKYAFGNDSSVRGVVIPKSVKETRETFVNNKAIELVVAEGLETVGYGTFVNCPALKQIKLGDNVLKIDVTAFSFCSKLEKINIPSSLTNTTSSDIKITFMYSPNLTIYGESGSFIEGVAQELGIPFIAE